MATSSYANLFGTNGSGKKNNIGFGNLFGQQEANKGFMEPKGGQETPGAPKKTFAEMQQDGEARPAPPPTPYQNLQKQVQEQLAKPVGYTTEQMQQLRQASLGQIQQQFGAQRSALEEDLARRGLAASTIAAGRFGDLAGQQAQAVAGLEAQLLQQQVQAQEAARAQGLQTLTTLAGQQADIESRAAQLMQEAELQGRSLDLQSARDLAQREQFTAQQTFEAQQAQLQRQFAGGESAAERALRESLMREGQTFEAAQAAAQRAFAGGESALERALRERLQTGAQTFEERQAELQRQFAGGESALERALRERLQTQQIGESAADRALRERLGLAEYTGTLDGQQTFAAQQARQNLLIQLAGILAQGGAATAGAMPQLLKLLADQFGFQMTTSSDDADLARRQQDAADRARRDAENARRAAEGLPPLPDNTQV